MRFLTYGERGELSFTEDLVGKDVIPPYAILSHRWGKDAEEVTFEDLAKNSSNDKPGYRKIQLCGKQAEHDGLKHFWIDTCCINKADKAEHSLAIQSMFHWYHKAARCYVYLSDVSASPFGGEGEANPPVWDSEFRKSNWFTRGWTLQELLAPSSVEFFSCDWHKLGDRISLKSQIQEVTSIPHAALRGVPLSQFSVDERLSWGRYRETKLPEDRVYAMRDILGVYISPFNGEGVGEAFKRLMAEVDNVSKCLRDLRPTDPRDDKRRIEDTKGGLLKDSYCWVLKNAEFQQWQNDPQSQLLWVKGDPGKGKTMLLCGIINELQNMITRTALVSYFFCQATDLRINNATAVLRGLLYLLVSQQPALFSHLRKKYDHAGKTMFEDANAWVALTEIFANVLRDPNLNATYLIIDALDECVVQRQELVEFVAKHSSKSSRVRWIVSSRNWPDIEEWLETADCKVPLSLELNAASVSTAVRVFIEQKVCQLVERNKYDEQTRNAVLKHLLLNANDTFLWVALVCQNLAGTKQRNVLKKLSLFPPGLESLYERMMQQISESDDAERCKLVLASIALVYRPIMLEELVALVKQLRDIADDSELREIIGSCGSFLALQGNTIYFVHQSAQDFLLKKAAREVFPSGKEAIHHAIFTSSLEVMSRTLKRDMYCLKSLGCPIKDVKYLDPDPLAASRYSCVYWVNHLCESKAMSSAIYVKDLQEGGPVNAFLEKNYLYWLEALSLCKSMPDSVVSMKKLQMLVQERGEVTAFTKLLYDALRFVMYHGRAIESSPLQVYASALLFSPRRSLMRQLFQHEESKVFSTNTAISDSWGACLQTLEGHSQPVTSVTFSPDSNRLASASEDRTVKIWDASSGTCLQTLEGHSDLVRSVAFSPDSNRLASASHDRTVKIWDASSGTCLQTLEGHSDWVTSVAFSPDSNRLASASQDMTVKIWDASSGTCLQTLEGHSSADPTSILASLHPDTTVINPQQLVHAGITVSADGTWISNDDQKLLWLPAEFRPYCSAVLGRCVGIGTSSGKVWMCCFR